MPLIRRAGKPTLHYRIDDYTDPWKKADTIILQHGYARSSRFWYGWVPYLSRFYKVVRPDLRGLGDSPVDFDPATGCVLEAYIEDVVAVLDELGLASAHYCGESFGGIVGMALAAAYPQRVRTLSLVAAPVFQSEQRQQTLAAGRASREEALRAMGTRKWAESIYGRSDYLPAGIDSGLRDWYVDQIGKSDVEVLCGLYGLLRHANAKDCLPRIEVSVLALYPTAGAATGTEQEVLLAEGIRDLRMVHLPSSSQAILTLYPAACAQHVLHFAAQHDGIACRE